MNFLQYWVVDGSQEAYYICYIIWLRPVDNDLHFIGINTRFTTPYNVTYIIPNSNLDIFKYNLSLTSTYNTCFTCLACSSLVRLKIRISAKQTMRKSLMKVQNTSFTTLINVVGALKIPKGITIHSYNHYLVLKAVFQISLS